MDTTGLLFALRAFSEIYSLLIWGAILIGLGTCVGRLGNRVPKPVAPTSNTSPASVRRIVTRLVPSHQSADRT
jgi:hypothetical protein